MRIDSARYQRISEVFLLAVQADPDSRAALLNSQCGADVELRREVESLLSHHDQTSNLISAAALGEDFRLGSAPDRPTNFGGIISQPARVGHYRILSVLGEGGMGVVYLAEQDRPRRTVALKVVKPGVMSQRALKRFEHETQVLGRLQHAGIAQILEAGTAEVDDKIGARAQPYFAMEYVRGRPLLAYATEHTLGTRQRLALLVQICHAVQHAHQHGIIHRDLKPSNILVVDDTDSVVNPESSTLLRGRPKILDFGVARCTDGDLQATTLQTDIGQLIGTIPYMSPEQTTGDSARLDARSDVYALGVIGYELLAARLPHDLRGKTIPEAVRIIGQEDPTPLSSVSRTFRGDLNTIVAKALEKDPARRYQSAGELALDVQRYLDDQPIIARPASAWYQFSKFARRNKALVGGVAAVFVLLVVGLVISMLLLSRARDAERLATERLDKAELETRKASAVSNFMTDMLASADPTERGRDVTVLQVLDGAVEQLAGSGVGEPSVEAIIRSTIALTYRSLGRSDLAEPHIVRAIELWRTLPESEDELQASLNILGLVQNDQGRWNESLASHREALAVGRRIFGDVHKELGASLNNVGLALSMIGREEEAEQAYREAIDMRRRALGKDSEDVAQSMINLGAMLKRQARFDEAEALIVSGVDIVLRILGEENPDYAIALDTLASLRSGQGRRAEAEALLRQSLAITREKLGDHWRVGVTLNDLAICVKDQGRYAEAEPLYIEAIEIRRRTLGSDHTDTARSMANYTVLLRLQGRLAEAEAMARESLEIRRRVFGELHADTASSMNSLALILDDLGRDEEAEAMQRRILEIRRTVLRPDHPEVAVSLNNLASLLRKNERFDEAEPLSREAVTIMLARHGENHPLTASMLHGLGIMLVEGNRCDEASGVLDRALTIRRAVLPRGHTDIALTLLQLGRCRVRGGDAVAAEPLLREAMEIAIAGLPAGHWQIDLNRIELGACLAAQRRFDEAEPLLVGGFESLRGNPSASSKRLAVAARRLVDLYDAWQKPEQAEQYREMLSEAERTSSASP